MAVSPAARPGRLRRWSGGLAWTLWALAMVGLAVTVWLDRLLRQAGRVDLAGLAPLPAVALVSAATVGAVLASRRLRHPVGWLLLALGLSVVAAGVAQGYAGYGLLARPGSLPSPRWRWWAIVTAAVPVVFLLGVPLGAGPLGGPDQSVTRPLAASDLAGLVLVPGLILTQLAALVDVASLVVRFRRTRGTERQQLRWVAFAAGLLAVAVVVVVVGALTGHPAVIEWTFGLFVALLPVAIGAAVLRYGCMTWTASSAARWPTGCSPCCWAAPTPGWSSASAKWSAATPACWWPARPWRWPGCSSRPAAASKAWWIAGLTGTVTTPPRRFRRSAPGCASRSTWTP
jgi:hypothetical protein